MPPRSPQLIVANTVNELMTAVPGPRHARGLWAVSPRKVWLAHEGDVVLTPRPVSAGFKAYACRLLDLDPSSILTLSPDCAWDELLAPAALASPLQATLLEQARTRPGLSVAPFAVDRPLLSLCRELGLPLAGWAALPDPALQASIYAWNTKSGFRAAATALGLRVVPGATCAGRAQLLRLARQLRQHTGGVIVKLDRSSNGYGHLLLEPADFAEGRLEARVGRALDAVAEQPRRFTLEALMPFASVPSAEFLLRESGPELLYLCDQRCPGASFSGMVTPPHALDPAVERELIAAGEAFAAHVHAQGYRGVLDVDAGVTPAGRLYVTETNLRRTGGTYLDALLRRLVGEDYLRRRVWWADSRPGRRLGFAQGREALSAAGLAYRRAAARGVILTADTVALDGLWRYLIVAREPDEAAAIERSLESVLGLAGPGSPAPALAASAAGSGSPGAGPPRLLG